MALYVGGRLGGEDHHDVHLMNEAGERLAARRLPEGVKGVAALHGLVAAYVAAPGEVIVGNRDRPRAMGVGSARIRLSRLRREPALGGPLPRAPPRRWGQVRRWRCETAG